MERELRYSIEKHVEKTIFLPSLVTFWQNSLQSLSFQTGGNVSYSFSNIAAWVLLNKVKYPFWFFRGFRKLIPLEYFDTTEKFFKDNERAQVRSLKENLLTSYTKHVYGTVKSYMRILSDNYLYLYLFSKIVSCSTLIVAQTVLIHGVNKWNR